MQEGRQGGSEKGVRHRLQHGAVPRHTLAPSELDGRAGGKEVGGAFFPEGAQGAGAKLAGREGKPNVRPKRGAHVLGGQGQSRSKRAVEHFRGAASQAPVETGTKGPWCAHPEEDLAVAAANACAGVSHAHATRAAFAPATQPAAEEAEKVGESPEVARGLAGRPRRVAGEPRPPGRLPRQPRRGGVAIFGGPQEGLELFALGLRQGGEAGGRRVEELMARDGGGGMGGPQSPRAGPRPELSTVRGAGRSPSAAGEPELDA